MLEIPGRASRVCLSREYILRATLHCSAGFWLHGDWERAVWRLLSFSSVRDRNTRCLWGRLPEILWRALRPARTAGWRTHRSLDSYQGDKSQGCLQRGQGGRSTYFIRRLKLISQHIVRSSGWEL